MPSLVEIDPMVLEKRMKMLKVYDNNNDAMDANDDKDGQRTNSPLINHILKETKCIEKKSIFQ